VARSGSGSRYDDDDNYEWDNDLASRIIAQRAIDELPAELSPARRPGRSWDERFEEATTPSRSPSAAADGGPIESPRSLGRSSGATSRTISSDLFPARPQHD
jgi:hypothetical protein